MASGVHAIGRKAGEFVEQSNGRNWSDTEFERKKRRRGGGGGGGETGRTVKEGSESCYRVVGRKEMSCVFIPLHLPDKDLGIKP